MNMKRIGIDVSKVSLDCCYLIDKESKNYRRKEFENRELGFKKLTQWIIKLTKSQIKEIQITLEATGVYHLKVVEYLINEGFKVCVATPSDPILFLVCYQKILIIKYVFHIENSSALTILSNHYNYVKLY